MDYIGLECVNGTVEHTNIYTAATVVKVVTLGLIDLVVVLGNSLVIAAVVTTRKLRTVTNIFIVSLACADLMLGFAVMPFSISYEVVKIWLWGNIWCSMWLAIDVLLCTASILSLCAISLDRYIAVTHPIRYPSLISPLRGKILVSTVWILSFVICLPPLLGWNDASETFDEQTGINQERLFENTSNLYANSVSMEFAFDVTTGDYFYDEVFSNFSMFTNSSEACHLDLPVCELTPTKGYRIYAAMGSFYIPSLIMVFFYFRIYLTAMKTAASLRSGVLLTRTSNEFAQHHGTSDDAIQLRIHRGGSTSSSQYSNRRTVANDANRYQTCVPERFNASSRTLSPRSQRSSSAHITDTSDCSLRDSLIEENNKNNNGPSKPKARSVIFIKPFCKRRSKVPQSNGNSSIGNYNGTQMEIMKSNSNCRANGSTNSFYKTNGNETNTSMNNTTPSPRRCKLLIKETKTSSYNAKGHARKFRRETKAAKTLAIIVGAFIVCWCPFFTIYLIGAFCYDCVSDIVFSVFFWLGYINSALNPCIYALFAREFRAAFQRIISCQRRKGFNNSTRADYVTGARKVMTLQQLELDSTSD